jgi:hypothetical protein
MKVRNEDEEKEGRKDRVQEREMKNENVCPPQGKCMAAYITYALIVSVRITLYLEVQ